MFDTLSMRDRTESWRQIGAQIGMSGVEAGLFYINQFKKEAMKSQTEQKDSQNKVHNEAEKEKSKVLEQIDKENEVLEKKPDASLGESLILQQV